MVNRKKAEELEEEKIAILSIKINHEWIPLVVIGNGRWKGIQPKEWYVQQCSFC